MSSTILDILALHSLGLHGCRYLLQNNASNSNETLLPTYSARLLCRPSPRQPRHGQTASQLTERYSHFLPSSVRRHNNVHSAPSHCPYTWSFRINVMKREAGRDPLYHFLCCCCVWGCLRVGRVASSCSRDLQVSFHRALSYSL